MTHKTIAFIGAGNMASSIIGGLIQNGWPADKIIGTGRAQEKLDKLQERFGIEVTTDNHHALQKADVVMLGVKPYAMQALLEDIAPSLESNKHLLISLAAGINMSSLEKWTSPDFAIVRSMPNTPSLLREGVTGLIANQQVNDDQKSLTDTIFTSTGIAQWVATEDMIDSIIAVSGSGPAYFFLFMEAMRQTGIELGFDEETAERLTVQTALGAARMAQEEDVEIAELRRRVTSPNGTTEQAIKTFQQGDLQGLVDKSMKAAVKRAQEMAKELG